MKFGFKWSTLNLIVVGMDRVNWRSHSYRDVILRVPLAEHEDFVTIRPRYLEFGKRDRSIRVDSFIC